MQSQGSYATNLGELTRFTSALYFYSKTSNPPQTPCLTCGFNGFHTAVGRLGTRLICIWTELSLRKVTGKLRPPLETAYSTLEESVCLAEPYVLKSGPHSPALHPARCANHARLSIRSGRSTPTLQAVSRLCCFPETRMCRASRVPAMTYERQPFAPA